MKRNNIENSVLIIVLILIIFLSSVLVWSIIRHHIPIIFPIGFLILIGILYWLIKRKMKNYDGGDIILTAHEGSPKLLNILKIAFPVFIFGLSILNNFYFRYDGFMIVFTVFFLTSLVIIFLISPKNIIFNKYGIRYPLYWEIRWTNFKGYTINNGVLIIKTVDNKERIIKDITNENSEAIDNLLKEKLNIASGVSS